MCQATQDQHKSLCHHKPRCKMIMHELYEDKEIRLNPSIHLWIQHVSNQKIEVSMQLIGEFKGFEQNLFNC